MDSSVDAVDDKADPVAELVREALVDQAAHDPRPDLFAMQVEAFQGTLMAARSKGTVDGFDDVAARTELAHRCFQPWRERPHPRINFLGEPIACQGLEPAEAEGLIKV